MLDHAEATGKASTERANCHRIARGSAMGAILDVVRLLRVVPDSEIEGAKTLLERIVSLPTRMCR